jgi:hypothetical protein
MAKAGQILFDGTNYLLTMQTTDWDEAVDLATVMGKAGLTDVQTSESPIQLSNGDNSGSEMIRLLEMERVNYTINNP